MATERIRGRKLQAIRKAYLARYPLCIHCLHKGITRLATEVDHIVALVNGGIESLDPFMNRQGLCADCHDVKTAKDLGHRPPKQAFDAQGNPIDSSGRGTGGWWTKFRKR